MNEKNQQVSDEQIDALIRSGLWQDEQPLTADEEKLADAAFARAMAKSTARRSGRSAGLSCICLTAWCASRRA